MQPWLYRALVHCARGSEALASLAPQCRRPLHAAIGLQLDQPVNQSYYAGLATTYDGWEAKYSPKDPCSHSSAKTSIRRSTSAAVEEIAPAEKPAFPISAMASKHNDVLDSLCKIYTVRSKPNFFMPWQNQPQTEGTGTGFVVDTSQKLVMTNAHVVSDQVFVMVKRQGSSTKYRAVVQAVGHPCDLALLHIADDAFWSNPTPMRALKFGKLPHLQDEVYVAGYPTGGDTVSVTTGVVSRVEMCPYAHTGTNLVAVQVDAAINMGNSGGPALQGDAVVGVAFQNMREEQNVGFIIPVPIVEHFMEEVSKHGSYRGFCSVGFNCQRMENLQLRLGYGMTEAMSGLLVTKTMKTMPAAGVIRPGDVMMAFDGHQIANDGTVSFRQRERILCDYLVSKKPIGSTADLLVFRDGKEVNVELGMAVNDILVPTQLYDTLPSYYIYAGFVFTVLSVPFLHEYGEEWYFRSPRKLYELAQSGMKEYSGQEAVLLSQVLVDEVNTGYQTLVPAQVESVNGEAVQNLKHLRRLIEESNETYNKLVLNGDKVIFVGREAALEAEARITEMYRIPNTMSQDIRDV